MVCSELRIGYSNLNVCRKPQINPQVVAQQMSQPVFKKEKLVTPKPKMPTESQKDENALKVAKKKKLVFSIIHNMFY